MTRNDWSLAGFAKFMDSDIFCLPVFSRKAGNRVTNFIQCTFAANSDYFELVPVSELSVFEQRSEAGFDPENTLYFGLCHNGRFSIVNRDGLASALAKVDFQTLGGGALAQYYEVLGTTAGVRSSRVELVESDPTFKATLSAQSFVESAATSIADPVNRSRAIRTIIRCSRWVTDWTISSLPSGEAKELQQILCIDLDALERSLQKKRDQAQKTFVLGDIEVQTGRHTSALGVLQRLRRQELRLSLLIKYILDDPKRGASLARQYKPQTKYEALVMPLIHDAAKRIGESERNQRQLIAAQLISKIYVKYFPVRRGRFLVDFIRTLGGYRIVLDQLATIYASKRGTYGVGLYSTVIDDLLAELRS